MEEKKKRPRLTKTDPDFSLKERTKSSNDDSEGIFERKAPENREKPFDSEFNRDRNQEGGFERRPDNREGGFERNREGGDERRPYNDRPDNRDRPFNPDRNREGGERRPYNDRPDNRDRPFNPDRNREGGGERRPYNDRPYNREGGGERRPYNDRNREGGGERRPYNDRNREGGGERRPYNDRPDNRDRPFNPDRNREGGGDRNREGGGDRRPYNREGGGERRPNSDRPAFGGGGDRNRSGGGDRKPFNNRGGSGGGGGFNKKPFGKKPFGRKEEFVVDRKPKPQLPSGEGMPLNKFLAHCGISSRRKAVEFIEQGLVTVNGEVKTEPYYRFQLGDVVTCQGNPVTIQERMVYVLLNKPKNVITTTDDDRGRTTVIDIVDGNFAERLYPVGRLDRDTTGLILITNDGDLAQKLSHPSHNVLKQYRVGLERSLTQRDEEKIRNEGVMLEDGLMEVNWIRFSEDHPERDVVEVEISSGRNRVIRRMFEALGYDVRKLDRFYFAGLTKKDLPRGQFRELNQREIVMLKHFTGHPSTGKKPEDMLEEDELDENNLPEIEVDTDEQDV
ncbi:MAG: pseudouridine synthase [Saprospiraceae bacterium]|nr:pseudouridine synthase [Saprospiraceae bacterium]